MKKGFILQFFRLFWVSFFLLALTQKGEAKEYKLPRHAEVSVVRQDRGSYLELRFMWDSAPDFLPTTAVEFDININPKCFVQPIGGRDDNHECEQRLVIDNDIQTNLPLLPSTWSYGEPNCYVDVWNYWVPSPRALPGLLEEKCGLYDWQAQGCGVIADVGRIFHNPDGLFSVGLRDATALQAGIEYFFRYPVELNLSESCVRQLGNGIDDGFAWVTMQTFRNVCHLPDPCNGANASYICPELIGLDHGGLACVGGAKQTQIWLNRLCVPTGVWAFTPGHGNLKGEGTQCVDMDNDQYFKNQSVPMFGTRTGDCNDQDDSINPEGVDICGERRIDGNCDGLVCQSGLCHNNTKDIGEVGIDCGGTCLAQCLPSCGDQLCNGFETVSNCCEDCGVCGRDGGLSTSSLHCSNGIQDGDETFTDCGGSCPPCASSATCSPGESAPCGDCGSMTCGSDGLWGRCQHEGRCTPGESQQRSCGTNGTQTATCSASCQWESWSTCQEGCVCLSGQCCDGCHFLPASTLCNNWRERRCQGPNPGQDVEEYYGAVYCSGRDEGCNGEEVRHPWSVSWDCSSSEVCDPSTLSCVPAPASCTASSSWSPSSDDELSPIGYQIDRTQPFPLRLQVRQDVEGGSNLEVQVCKDPTGTTFDNDIAFYITAFEGGILEVPTLATRGRTCSQWLDIPGTNTYREGQTFNGVWHIVSPASSRSDWNFPYSTCSARPGAGGTCWSGHSLALTRTCR